MIQHFLLPTISVECRKSIAFDVLKARKLAWFATNDRVTNKPKVAIVASCKVTTRSVEVDRSLGRDKTRLQHTIKTNPISFIIHFEKGAKNATSEVEGSERRPPELIQLGVEDECGKPIRNYGDC
jgi:hypothetical protein